MRLNIVNRPSLRTRSILLAGGIAVSVLLTGCGGITQNDARSGDIDKLEEVSIESFKDVRAILNEETGEVSLPLDPYVDQEGPYALWGDLLLAAGTPCVDRAGIALEATSTNSERDPKENRLFGRWSVAKASQFGLGDDPNSGPQKTLPLPKDASRVDEVATCFETARTKLAPLIEGADMTTKADQIFYESSDAALTHPDAVAVINARSECAKDKGIVLSKEGYPDESYATADLSQQITAAVAFAECQHSTGAIQTLFDLTAQYQAAYMEKYEAQLSEILKERNARADALAEALASL